MSRDRLMGEEQMPFAVARVRARENTLLSDQDLKNLMACEDYHECIQYLLDRGWGPADHDHNTPEELILLEKKRLWEFIDELLNKEQQKFLDVFRISSDYHNLKAAIKESYIQKEVPHIYMTDGTINPELIRSCAAEGEFGHLPPEMAQAGAAGREALFRAGDPQLCEVIIDRACLEHIKSSAEASGNDLLMEYAELKCASANISIAIRACKTGKDEEFLRQAFVDCKTLSREQLIAAARNGIEQVYEYLEQTSYRDCVEAIRQSPAVFDRWCDNRMIGLIRPQKYNAFTISPVIAYVLGKEYELKSVRLILSGRHNDLPQEKIEERLRESYV